MAACGSEMNQSVFVFFYEGVNNLRGKKILQMFRAAHINI